VDAGARQLLRDGREVPLSPKAFQLLVLLVENRERAVSRQELHQHLWPSTFVLETNLASLIAELRRALGDNAAKPQFIRTMHRFGYRFVAPVEEALQHGEPEAMAKYWLVWEARHVALSETCNLIGRGQDAHVWIDAPGVSRHHARIVVDDGGATLEDLESKNGTYLAGERVVSPRRLSDGDQIRLGSVIVTFRIPRLSGATATIS
jgi:DNA-binding winged helix-turn-helix (wHTH) protein